jgi:hypothetical protein
VRHQPCDAAVAVKERVNPHEPVMRRRGGEDGFGLAEAAIGGAGTDGDVRADRNIAVAQFARDHPDPLFGRRVHGPQKIVR